MTNTCMFEQRRGIKTVFNIRLSNEAGYVDLGKELGAVGISYVHCPIDYCGTNESDVDKLLDHLSVCPKPCLLFCQVGFRAAAMGIAFKTSQVQTARALSGCPTKTMIAEDDAKLLEGFSSADQHDSGLKSFVESYVASKVHHCLEEIAEH